MLGERGVEDGRGEEQGQLGRGGKNADFETTFAGRGYWEFEIVTSGDFRGKFRW